jgi:adenylate kinase family enzyme
MTTALRTAIIGNSGSGKSTLAGRLAADYAAATLDLDTVAWLSAAPPVMRAAEDALRDVRTFCRSHDSWVVEGCYASLIAGTFEYEPELLLLDPGLDKCIAHCRARPWEPHKYASKEAQDTNLPFLIEWVRDYYTRDGDMSFTEHRALYDRYSGPKRIVNG